MPETSCEGVSVVTPKKVVLHEKHYVLNNIKREMNQGPIILSGTGYSSEPIILLHGHGLFFGGSRTLSRGPPKNRGPQISRIRNLSYWLK